MGRRRPDEPEIAHGYSLEDIHGLAGSVTRTMKYGTTEVSPGEMYDTAVDAMIDVLLSPKTRDEAPSTYLINAAKWAVMKRIMAVRKHYGGSTDVSALNEQNPKVNKQAHGGSNELTKGELLAVEEDFTPKADDRMLVSTVLVGLSEKDQSWLQDYMDHDCNWAAVGRKRGVSSQYARVRGLKALEAAREVAGVESERAQGQ